MISNTFFSAIVSNAYYFVHSLFYSLLSLFIRYPSIHDAAERGSVWGVRIFLAQGVNINALDEEEKTPLHHAIFSWCTELVHFLLEHDPPADLNPRDKKGQTPLHRAIAIKDGDEIVRLLLEKNANPEARDEKGQTPLHFAVIFNNLKVIPLLINCNLRADINARDDDGRTPLHRAAVNGYINAMKFLIQQGADLEVRNKTGLTSLHIAAFFPRVHVIEFLLQQRANIEALDENNHTPLHYAVHAGYIEIVRVLLAQKAQIEARNEYGNTPLYLAVLHGRIDIVNLLLKSGANVNVQNNSNASPIMVAFQERHFTIVNLLRAYGAVLPADLADINNDQSVHKVHEGVSNSAEALHRHYHLTPEEITEALSELEAFVDKFPYDPETTPITDKFGAAKRGLAQLNTPGFLAFIDPRSGIPLREALALVWRGLNDPKQSTYHQDEQERKAILTEIIIEWLYNTQRNYNIFAVTKEDNGKSDSSSCPSGAFNIAIYTLNHHHSLVDIPFVTEESITAKVIPLANEFFDTLTEKERNEYAKASQKEFPHDLIERLQKTIEQKLHNEFDQFHSENFDVNKAIGNVLRGVPYLPIAGLQHRLKKINIQNELLQRFASPKEEVKYCLNK